MFNDTNANNKINKVHERTLKELQKDDCATFNELETKIDLYQCIIGIFKNQKIRFRQHYRLMSLIKLRSHSEFILPPIKTVHRGHD